MSEVPLYMAAVFQLPQSGCQGCMYLAAVRQAAVCMYLAVQPFGTFTAWAALPQSGCLIAFHIIDGTVQHSGATNFRSRQNEETGLVKMVRLRGLSTRWSHWLGIGAIGPVD